MDGPSIFPRPLPALPLEIKHEVLKFCDPSTLAQTSRVSLAFLQLSSPLLYRNVEIDGIDRLDLLFCQRINAFASSSHFTGNRCPVVLFPSSISKSFFPDETLRLIAYDWQMAEVAFIFERPESPSDEWGVRFFTDEMEPRLCGHATFSSAHYLLSLHLHLPSVTLHTPSGPYLGTRLPNNTGTQITLPSADFVPFPSDDINGEIIFAATCAGFGWTLKRAQREGLIKFVGLTSGEGGRKGRYDYESFALVEVDGELLEGGLEGVKVFGAAYASLPRSIPILVVTSRPPSQTTTSTSPPPDFISRVFNHPIIATSFEDDVTGTAHAGVLAPYWSKKLLSTDELGKTELVASQVSRRGGGMRVCWDGKSAGDGGWTHLRSVGVESGRGWMLVPIAGTSET